MRKATKTIISFAVVLIAGLNFFVPAFADSVIDNNIIGAVDIFSIATGIDIAISGMTGSGASYWASQNGFGANDFNDAVEIDFDPLSDWNIYYRRNDDDTTTVQIENESSIGQYFLEPVNGRIELFIDENQIPNVGTGTIYQQSGTFNGVPLYTQVLRWDSAATGMNWVAPGGVEITCTNVPYAGLYDFRVDYGQITGSGSVSYLPHAVRYVNIGNNIVGIQIYRVNNINQNMTVNLGVATTTAEVSYQATNVQQKLVQGQTLGYTHATIPDSALHNFNPVADSGYMTKTEFKQYLQDIAEAAVDIQQLLESQYSDHDISQDVPPTPLPDTPLGEVPFDDWVDLWGQGIYEQLENQSDALDFIGSNGTDAIEELESIDENIGALEETAESIDTNIGIGNGILGGIRSLAQDAVDSLEGIAEHVGELVEEIVEGTETLIAGILNQIPQAFGVIFGPIKQASSIWHYVVEWITSIGAPFQFIWSMASGTSYYVILPVYASLAAAVVLAFFKRFGR